MKFIRDAGKLWELAVFLSELADKLDNKENSHLYQGFTDFIHSRKIADIFLLHPLLNGNDVKTLFNINKGPLIGVVMSNLIEWQALNPTSTAEELRAAISNDPTFFQKEPFFK